MARVARRGCLRRLLALAAGLALAVLCAELGLRWLLFSESALARRLGAGLRRPGWYADGDGEDAYWKLGFRFAGTTADAARLPDALLGWRNERIAAGSHAHEAAGGLGARRPVLLYGDSFAEGVTADIDSFQGLLERSTLGADHALLNFGVGGFGLDQILLLARDTLDDWRAREPVAIAAILVESDLDRCVLAFRSGPKPRFELEHGHLSEPGPVETSVERFLERHPPGITSYLGRLLCYAPGGLPRRLQFLLRGDVARSAEKRTLGEALLRELCRELRRSSPHPAVLVLHDLPGLRASEAQPWREELLRRVCAEEAVPLLETRAALLAAAGGDARGLEALFVAEGPGAGHYNRLGNMAVFEVLRAFLLGESPERALTAVGELQARGLWSAAAPRRLERTLLGCELEVLWQDAGETVCFAALRDARGDWSEDGLALRAGDLGPTRMRLRLPPGTVRLRLRASARAAAESAEDCALRIGSLTVPLRTGEDARELELAAEPGWLACEVAAPASGARSPWVLIEDARLEQR